MPLSIYLHACINNVRGKSNSDLTLDSLAHLLLEMPDDEETIRYGWTNTTVGGGGGKQADHG